jgi:hypothetical protein
VGLQGLGPRREAPGPGRRSSSTGRSGHRRKRSRPGSRRAPGSRRRDTLFVEDPLGAYAACRPLDRPG